MQPHRWSSRCALAFTLGVLALIWCAAGRPAGAESVASARIHESPRDAAITRERSHSDEPAGVVAGTACGPCALTLAGDPCFEIGDQVEVTVTRSNASEFVTGAVVFLAYSTAMLDVVAVFPGDGLIELLELVDDAAGEIDFAVGLPPGGTPFLNGVIAVLVFEVVGDDGTPFVVFRNDPPTQPPCALVNAGRQHDVDLRDFAALRRCFTADATPANEDCRCLFDTDGDGDIDDLDYAAWHPTLTGPSLWTCGG